MPTARFRPPLIVPAHAVALALLIGGCGDRPQKAANTPGSGFVSPKRIETGPDGLARLIGETGSYTGQVILMDKAMKFRAFANYEGGRLHGPEIRYYEDGKLRRQYDYQYGEKIHHREWFPNGNLKIDSTMRNGVAYGTHRTWFEDGRPRWSGNFVDNLLWQGHIIDYAPDGTLMWDAIFEKGRYVSGVYPEAEQEKMIADGLVPADKALYPRKP